MSPDTWGCEGEQGSALLSIRGTPRQVTSTPTSRGLVLHGQFSRRSFRPPPQITPSLFEAPAPDLPRSQPNLVVPSWSHSNVLQASTGFKPRQHFSWGSRWFLDEARRCFWWEVRAPLASVAPVKAQKPVPSPRTLSSSPPRVWSGTSLQPAPVSACPCKSLSCTPWAQAPLSSNPDQLGPAHTDQGEHYTGHTHKTHTGPCPHPLSPLSSHSPNKDTPGPEGGHVLYVLR